MDYVDTHDIKQDHAVRTIYSGLVDSGIYLRQRDDGSWEWTREPRPFEPEPAKRPEAGSPFEPEPEPRFYEPEQPNAPPFYPVEHAPTEPVHEYPERHVHPVTVVHPEQVIVPEAEPEHARKTIRETIPESGHKQFPEQFGNNSPNNSETELLPNSLEPSEPAPQAAMAPYKKKGKVGRQRKYEEPGNNGEIPVKKVVLFRHIQGRHWPGMSQDMQEWYDKYYFTKPKRTGKGVDHARHIKSYERGQRWIAEHEGRDYQPGAVGHSAKIVAYRKRANS